MVLLPKMILRKTVRVSAGLTTMPQKQPQSQMPSQEYANYAMGFFAGKFLFQS